MFFRRALLLAIPAGLALFVSPALGQQSGSSRDATRDIAFEIGRSLLKSLIDKDEPGDLAVPRQPDVQPSRGDFRQPGTLPREFPGSPALQPPRWNGVEPRENRLMELGQGETASYAMTQRLGREVDGWLDEQISILRFGLEQVVISDAEREQIIDKLSGRVSRRYVIELQDALIDEDPDAVERAAKKAELSQSEREKLVRRVALIRAAKDFFRLVESGASGLALHRRIKQAKHLIANLDLSDTQRQQIEDRLEAVLAAASARHAMEHAAIAGGTKLNWPSGTVPVVYDPSLPHDKVQLLGGYAIVVGTSGQGVMRAEMTTAARVIGVPVAEGEPVPEWRDSADPLSGVVIANPDYTRTAVNYLVNNRTYRTEPGENLKLDRAGSYLVEFDRGGSFGRARYNLSRGVYIFVPSARGWDLFRMPYQITIDNSENPHDFHFVIDKRRERVAAYDSKTITAESPFEFVFDRGEGKELSRKMLLNGIYKVAISPSDNLWELYEAHEMTTADPQSVVPASHSALRPSTLPSRR